MVSQVDHCVQVVVQAFRKIDEHENEIARRQDAIRLIKDHLDRELVEAAAGLDREETNELAYLLYWHTSIPTDTIGQLLDVGSANRVANILGGFPSGDFCQWCGKEFLYKSRTQRQQILRTGRHNLAQLCDQCRENYWAQNEAERQQQIQKQLEQIAAYKAMPYREYLKTEHWQEVRKSALKRSRYRCQLCNEKGVLDVHHRTYERRGEEEAADVIVLCRDCHGRFHDKV